MSTDKDVSVFVCDVGSHRLLQEAQEVLEVLIITKASVRLILGAGACEAELPGFDVKMLLSASVEMKLLKLSPPDLSLLESEKSPLITPRERSWGQNQRYIGPDRFAQRRFQDRVRRGRRNR